MTVEAFWERFLRETGRPETTKYVDVFHFELTEEWANKLLELVLEGKKRATASSLPSYQISGEPVPKPGDLCVVTNWDGEPRCVLETTAVVILPFREMTFEICLREGEDECLETWQRGHRHFFTEEGKAVGFEFTEDMPVIFEDFRVAWQV